MYSALSTPFPSRCSHLCVTPNMKHDHPRCFPEPSRQSSSHHCLHFHDRHDYYCYRPVSAAEAAAGSPALKVTSLRVMTTELTRSSVLLILPWLPRHDDTILNAPMLVTAPVTPLRMMTSYFSSLRVRSGIVALDLLGSAGVFHRQDVSVVNYHYATLILRPQCSARLS